MLQKISVISLLALIVFSGCLQPQPEEPGFLQGSEDQPLDFIPVDETTTPVQPAPIPGNCSAMDTQVSKDICIFNTAVEESDVSQCLNLSELWQKNNCVSGVARERQDTSICSNMESAFGPDNTNVRYSCIADVALGALYTDACISLAGSEWASRCAQNPSLQVTEECINLESEAWESICWEKVVKTCSEIPSQDWRELCLKKSAIDAASQEKCLTLHDFERDTCLEQIAIAYQKPETCDLIDDETIKESCLERASVGAPSLQ